MKVFSYQCIEKKKYTHSSTLSLIFYTLIFDLINDELCHDCIVTE